MINNITIPIMLKPIITAINAIRIANVETTNQRETQDIN